MIAGVWGGIKGFHKFIKWFHGTIVKSIIEQMGNPKEIADDVRVLTQELAAIKKEVTPNGKNTARLGDTAARTEQKVDNLSNFLERYAEKVDTISEKLEHHLGVHEGEKE